MPVLISVVEKVKALAESGETDYMEWQMWAKENVPGLCHDRGIGVGIHVLHFVAHHTMKLPKLQRFGTTIELWVREGIVYHVEVGALSYRSKNVMGAHMVYSHTRRVLHTDINAAHSKIREVYRRRLCSDIKNVADGLLARRSGMSVLNSGVSGDYSIFWRQPDGLRQAKHCPVDCIVWMRELREGREVVRIQVHPDEAKQVTGIFCDGKITWIKEDDAWELK